MRVRTRVANVSMRDLLLPHPPAGVSTHNSVCMLVVCARVCAALCCVLRLGCGFKILRTPLPRITFDVFMIGGELLCCVVLCVAIGLWLYKRTPPYL